MVWRRKKDTKNPQASGQPTSAHLDQVAPQVVGDNSFAQQGTLEAVVKNSDPIPVAKGAVSFKFHSAAADQTKRAYVIPRGYTVRGDILSERPVEIEGEYGGGSLIAQQVTVLPGGVLNGTVEVDVLRVAGCAPAQVSARSCVEVISQGELLGNVTAPRLSVSAGARLSRAELRIGGV
jgi:cytoskeletal protein CcmA (bactofilin family)